MEGEGSFGVEVPGVCLLKAAMVSATDGVAISVGASSGSPTSPSEDNETEWKEEVEFAWLCPFFGAPFNADWTSRN